MVQPLSGPSRLLASGFGHPRLRMVQPLSGLSRLLASVRIWPDERYGVGGNDSITTVCQVQAGNAALPLWERAWG